MSIQMRVAHTTGLSYRGEVASSYNEARMTPVTTSDQVVLHSRVDVTPSPWTYAYLDYWGTAVTAFEVHEPHERLSVTATSTVEINRHRPVEAGHALPAYAERSVREDFCELLDTSTWVATPPDLAAQVREMAARTPRASDLAREICGLVHREVAYVQGATVVTSTAADAWKARQGVCQDMVHLTIGALRSLGVPTRYVSGYLHPSSEPEIGETVAGESHAWIEWWDGEWIGFDPTNDVEPSDRHVVVGHGRDYSDIAPLVGIFSGGDAAAMTVEVALTRLR